MKKQWYDHKTKLCEGCGWYRPEGPRPEMNIGQGEIWKESCRKYGYTLNPYKYKELADNCEGFMTPIQVAKWTEEYNKNKEKYAKKSKTL